MAGVFTGSSLGEKVGVVAISPGNQDSGTETRAVSNCLRRERSWAVKIASRALACGRGAV